MATNNSSNQQYANASDGFTLAGGTTSRTLTVTGGNATITGSGSAVVTFPSSTSTLATLALSESLTNKTLDNTNTITIKDTLFTIQDDGDTTKQAVFQLSGITTGTTRTLTIPNSSSTLAVLGLAQTFTATQTFADVKLGTAGNGLYIKEGSNATMGVVTLSSGSATVSTTKVTSTSRIFLTTQGGTLTNVGATYVSARTAATSFVITSLNILDSSDVAWHIIEPA